MRRHLPLVAAIVVATAAAPAAQGTAAQAPAPSPPATAPVVTGGIQTPAGYVIGADDELEIVFWREKDLSSTARVRPDGKISLPLLNDIAAGGLTPDQLRGVLQTAAANFIEEPNVTVVVKAINSRRVFVTGQVGKPGPYPLLTPTTVLQLIATAGGLNEYADRKNIRIVRTEGDRAVARTFNYEEISKGRDLAQNIELQPGDTVIVP